jgi:cytidylate kinase
MSVITISRQSGSEGNKIVRIISKRLGWKFFDKNLMAQLAARVGEDPKKVKDITENEHHIKTFWEKVFANIAIPPMTTPWVLSDPYELKEEMTVHQVSEFIQATYGQENVIIVGRGSQVVLKDKPFVLHVRIIAPLERRIERWMEREDLSRDEAEKITKVRDHQHAHFVRTYFDEDVNNPDLYDLIISTEKLYPENAADLIIKAVKFI